MVWEVAEDMGSYIHRRDLEEALGSLLIFGFYGFWGYLTSRWMCSLSLWFYLSDTNKICLHKKCFRRLDPLIRGLNTYPISQWLTTNLSSLWSSAETHLRWKVTCPPTSTGKSSVKSGLGSTLRLSRDETQPTLPKSWLCGSGNNCGASQLIILHICSC